MRTCSAVYRYADPRFTYAKGFGIVGHLFGDDFFLNVPNGLVGMLYYAITFVLSFTDDRWAVTAHYYLTIASNLSSFYLAFVLALIIRELCLVCLATYLINAASVVCVVAKLRRIKSRHSPQKPKSD
ncbi:Vitamin K epoxide reductase [Cinara cedri]|uniref:vitamin-K-epoxide reductase (warfarin-sensitive) n=1 Tax=Cinara cedri TaxID=506608 RepID=A0A5E4NEY0_9HEMI|nr:Vitamin K epoxide reductase [Cinara cedri]